MAIDQDQPSTSSASPTGITNTLSPAAKEESLKTALNALVHGKRHLLVKDVTLAISSLGEACRLLTEAYGPFGAHNAEAHFYYGKALLEQSRLDLAVFEGPECPKTESGEDDSEEDESEEDESEDKENEAESTATRLPTNTDSNTNENRDSSDTHTNGVSTSNAHETDETEPVDVKVDKQDDKEMEVEENVESHRTPDNGSVEMEQGTSAATEEDLNIPSPSDSKTKDADSFNDQPSTSRGPQLPDTAEAEIEEELGNLQLAWEVLEVAKVAFHRKIDELKAETTETKKIKTENDNTETETMKQLKELEKRLADTHLLLGEVATESEMYGEAVQEFQTGLLLLTKIEEPDSREIAQYYFQIGLAYAFGKSFGDAIDSFKKSVEIIEQRIRNLSEKVGREELSVNESKEDTNEESGLSVLKREIEELNALLPELQEKISDTIDAENESKKAKEEESKEQEIIMRNSPVKNPNPPVANDISHLVKKRKKVDEGPQAEPPSKRICNLFPQQEDVSSSTMATNRDKNVSVVE